MVLDPPLNPDSIVSGYFLLQGVIEMQSADTCDWYTPALEKQLCWYFECTKENLLAMLSKRKEETDKGGLCHTVSFKTPQQTRRRECIYLEFAIAQDKTKAFTFLYDWYFSGSGPEYRFVSRAPNPVNPERLHTVGGGF